MRLRPLASTLRPLLLVLALLLAGAGLSGVASAQSAMPRYAELQRDVDFWIRVYTEISTRQGFVHDARNLGVVYGVAALPDAPPGSDPRRDAITAARDRWSAALRAAADALTAGQPLQGDAAWVHKVWRDALGRDPDAGTLTAALADVRFQLGQADRFRAGVERSGAWREHIAAVMRTGLRRDDRVTLAGEGFTIIVPGADERTAVNIAERLRRRIAQMRFPHLGGEARLSASFGVAADRKGDSADRIAARARHALQAALARGPDHVVPASEIEEVILLPAPPAASAA